MGSILLAFYRIRLRHAGRYLRPVVLIRSVRSSFLARPWPRLGDEMLLLIYGARFVFIFAVMKLWRYSLWTSIPVAAGLA